MNDYSPSNWTITNSSASSNGTVNTSNAPISIGLVYPTTYNQAVTYSIQVTETGTISFDWHHVTNDPYVQWYEYPNFALNNYSAQIFNGYDLNNTTGVQNGSQIISVQAGDMLHLIAYDAYGNINGNTITTINNFKFKPQCSSLTWAPGNLAGNSITVSPSTTTSYNLHIADTNGCSTDSALTVTVKQSPAISLINATPNSICQGGSSILEVATSQCGSYNNFSDAYALSQWNVINSPGSNGIVDTSGSPNSVNFTFPTNVATTTLSKQFTQAGTISFNWTSSIQFAYYQNVCYPNFSINNNPAQVLYGFNQYGSNNQSGTFSIPVNAGDVFNFITFNANGGNLNMIMTISDFHFTTANCNVMWTPGNISSEVVTVNPTSTTTYTVTATSVNGCTATSTQTIDVNLCTVDLNIKAILQGYYTGGGVMNSTLMNEGLPNPSNDVDSIIVELHSTSSPYAMMYSTTSILHTDGTLQCNFPGIVNGNEYYIVLKHRNSIQTWSANPILLTTNTNYDFTTSSNKAYGENMVEIETGIFALYSGDINQDENIDLLDISLLEVDINNFEFGYFTTDINGDGNVDLLDASHVENNVNGFIFAIKP